MEWDDRANEFRESAVRLKQEALKLRQAVLDEAPSLADGWLLVADIEEELGRLDHAIQATRRFLALSDEPALPVLNHLGHLLYDAGRYAQAAICLQKTSAEGHKAHRWVQYGISLLKVRVREDALRALEQAIECDPTYDEAHLNLGLWLADENPEKARQHLERALELDPRCAANYGGLALAALREKEYEEAARLGREGLSIDPMDRLCRRALAQALEGLGRVEEAESQFRQAVEYCPDDPECRAYLAIFLRNQGRYREAEEEHQRLLRGWPDHELAYSTYAEFLERGLGRNEEAAELRKALAFVRSLRTQT